MLVKPGIIRGNLLTAIGGFFLAAEGHIDYGTLLSLLAGMALVIASSCVFNNYLDRDIDRYMARTQKRVTASGNISARALFAYGTVLGTTGFAILLLGTNVLTALLGLLGFVTYVGVYTPAKHRTPYATLLGTIPGALPPVAGYTAVTGHLDLAAWLLFIILICWQMPHFYAIAIRRLDEYAAAGVPIWPIKYGFASTRHQMILYSILFVCACACLTLAGYSGYVFLLFMVLFGGYWVYLIVKGGPDKQLWAKRVFLFSLPILPLFSLLLVADHWLF